MMNIVHGFMKKLLGILVLGFLFSGNANAGVNEPGSGHIAAIKNVKSIYYEHLAKVKKLTPIDAQDLRKRDLIMKKSVRFLDLLALN